MTQTSLWQETKSSAYFAELCNALYERELRHLANAELSSAQSVQARLKSLPYYINRTAFLMLQSKTPLTLDRQNATWSAQQSSKIPLTGQDVQSVIEWYSSVVLTLGLVVPIALDNRIVLDSIDKVDNDNKRFRTNRLGWFDIDATQVSHNSLARLLKPNKKVMTAACAGHIWQGQSKLRPAIPTLRELLLSCGINWQNFKKVVAAEGSGSY